MRRLCFGIYANVLVLCAAESTTKQKLLNSIVQSVAGSCKLTPNAVTGLLRCNSNLPGSRSNSLGNVIAGAQTASPKAVAEYFSKKVIPLIDPNKRKLAVLAIRDIIASDETIRGDTVIENVSGTTKKALLSQSRFTLSDFLAGVFLFTVSINNRCGKDTVPSITKEYLLSFEDESEAIGFSRPNKTDMTVEADENGFWGYMQSVKAKYGTIKTLLYNDHPKPFYDFYIPNYIEYRTGQSKNPNSVIEDITVHALTGISNYLIITGTGGLGKSMAMRHLLLNAIEDYKNARLFPVFIPLKDYGESADYGLFSYVFSKIAALNSRVSKEAFESTLVNGSFLLLFDGLDEIDGSHRERFEREIDAFTDKYPSNCYVISSRPFQSFISFGRFSTVKLRPFTKAQALLLIDKLDFRPDQPEIKAGFRAALDTSLYRTHNSFAQNPLLLTIMLLTYERFAEVPSKMHIFYREAFLALSVTHDASKGAFKRALKTGLNIDAFSDRFAEICFRSYRDEKYEFTNIEFAEYYSKSSGSSQSAAAGDFLYDLCSNLCLMFFESGRYHFVHRSFQEYFAALFMSMQKDEFISKLGDFFEKRSIRAFSNSAFSMLYDIIPDRVEEFILVPYLSALFADCDSKEGYWTFLETMYPIIRYEHGETPDYSCNDPESYLFEFITLLTGIKYKYGTNDLPFEESFVEETYKEDLSPIAVGDTMFEWPYYEMEEGEEPPEPEIVGWQLEFDVEDVRQRGLSYAELLSVLDDNEFIFKKEYLTARALLSNLTIKHQKRQDDLLDLL